MKRVLVVGMLVMVVVAFVAGDAMAVVITSAADAALSGSTDIDFQSQTVGTYSSSLVIGDVTFTPNNNFLRIATQHSGLYNTTGKYLDNTSNGFTSATFSFANDVNAFGFNWGASDTDWTLYAYDSAHSLLDSYVIPKTQGSNSGDFFGLAVDDIAYATVTMTGNYAYSGNDWVLLDNFSYVTDTSGGDPVPEPATMVLLGASLFGLAGFKKKK